METQDFISESRKVLQKLRAYFPPSELRLLSKDQNLWAKCEFQNPTGSFKIRPAFSGLWAGGSAAKSKGVLAASTGNFAQAVAYAARELGRKAKIVMMPRAEKLKVQKTEDYGGEVIFSPQDTFESREETFQKLKQETQSYSVHPFNTWETLLGDATCALELLDQSFDGEPWDVFIPASGGGLLAGMAIVLKTLRPNTRVIGCQPLANSSLEKSFRAKSRVRVGPFQTVCDSLMATSPGDLTLEQILKFVDDVVSPTEDEILSALRELWNQYQIVVEPGCAVALAASKKFSGGTSEARKKILVLTGLNVDPQKWEAWVRD